MLGSEEIENHEVGVIQWSQSGGCHDGCVLILKLAEVRSLWKKWDYWDWQSKCKQEDSYWSIKWAIFILKLFGLVHGWSPRCSGSASVSLIKVYQAGVLQENQAFHLGGVSLSVIFLHLYPVLSSLSICSPLSQNFSMFSGMQDTGTPVTDTWNKHFQEQPCVKPGPNWQIV